MVVCPACGSSRIRNDYKPAPLALRVIGIRALLCDHCNRQFRAFSPRLPKSYAPRRPELKADAFNPATAFDLDQFDRNSTSSEQEQTTRIWLNRFATPDRSEPPVAGELLAPIPRDLRTQITKLYEQGVKQMPTQMGARLEDVEPHPSAVCPECGSQHVRRRRRRGIERAVFSLTDHKAFNCRSCGAAFYAKLEEENRDSLNSSDSAIR